jgi:hypothetical protein
MGMQRLELIEVGDGLGIIFSEAMCARLKVRLGDEIHLIPTPHCFELQSNPSDSAVSSEKTPDDDDASQNSAFNG